MNILLVHQLRKSKDGVTFGAVPYYRMQKPHEVLKRMYPEFDYITADSIYIEHDLIRQVDLIIFTRIVEQEDIDMVNKWGKAWGIDVDDYWHLPEDHILHPGYIENKIPERIENGIKQAHFVTCTTEVLAEYIKPLNDNVYVIENGIDSQEWVSNKTESSRIRFGFTQGTTHVPDIMLINREVQRSLYDWNFSNKCQVVLCGFNAEYQKESVYIGYERMLTDDLKCMPYAKEYVHELKTLYCPPGLDKPYRRIESVPVEKFYSIHNELDIIVAPLKKSEFNSCKSNIKMLEAGFMDCAVMCHNVAPYDLLMTEQNSFDLNERNFFEWQRYILNNPIALEDRQLALNEDVQKFELNNLTDKRKSLYESILN